MSYTFIDDIAQNARPARPKSRNYRTWGKRIFDIIVVILAAPFVLPMVLLAGLFTMLSGGKAYFVQPRIGLDGKVFRCWKIRTMVDDADQVLSDLIKADPAVAREWAAHQKLDNDPRITALGNILRKTSIDELPQFWNVLVGDMSLIGPRPFTRDQKELYDAVGKPAYYRVRPGISGLWQVECRHVSEFQERADFDDSYVENISLWNDLKIAIRTFGVVLRGTGK